MDSSLSSRRYSFKQFENLTLDIYSFLIEESGSSTAMFTQIPFIIWLCNLIATRGHDINRFQKWLSAGWLPLWSFPEQCQCHIAESDFLFKNRRNIFSKNLSWCVNDAAVPDVSNFQCGYLHEIETDFRILKYLNTGSRSVNFMKKVRIA